MPTAVKTYDAKMDSKKRITLRNALYEYYHVEEFDDGRIVLEPRELVPPFQISEKSLAMMDQAMENLKQGKVSKAVDLSAWDEYVRDSYGCSGDGGILECFNRKSVIRKGLKKRG